MLWYTTIGACARQLMQASSVKYSITLVKPEIIQWLAVANADHPNSAFVGLLLAYLLL